VKKLAPKNIMKSYVMGSFQLEMWEVQLREAFVLSRWQQFLQGFVSTVNKVQLYGLFL
jgi:hypothetical protein